MNTVRISSNRNPSSGRAPLEVAVFSWTVFFALLFSIFHSDLRLGERAFQITDFLISVTSVFSFYLFLGWIRTIADGYGVKKGLTDSKGERFRPGPFALVSASLVILAFFALGGWLALMAPQIFGQTSSAVVVGSLLCGASVYYVYAVVRILNSGGVR